MSARKAQRPNCAGKESCQVAGKDRKADPQVVFQCAGGCKRTLHWECVGYAPELSALPVISCPLCLKASGCSAGAAGVALSKRCLLVSYAKEMAWTVSSVPLDGACMLRSVALAVNEPHLDVFKRALGVVATLDIPEVDRDTVLAQCKKLLDKRSRRMGDDWNSKLFDYLSQALAIVTGRPLHIYEVMGGNVKRHVVLPKEGPASLGAASPILLMRSNAEIGVPHYDFLHPAVEKGGVV